MKITRLHDFNGHNIMYKSYTSPLNEILTINIRGKFWSSARLCGNNMYENIYFSVG